MKSSAEKLSLVIRTLLLVICCALFLPQNSRVESDKVLGDSSLRSASVVLAITGISNPASQLQQLANGESSALRASGQRTGVNAAGKRTSISSPGKRDRLDWVYIDDGGDFFAALPDISPLPGAFLLCKKERFSFCALPPESHGHLLWNALAPPCLA